MTTTLQEKDTKKVSFFPSVNVREYTPITDPETKHKLFYNPIELKIMRNQMMLDTLAKSIAMSEKSIELSRKKMSVTFQNNLPLRNRPVVLVSDDEDDDNETTPALPDDIENPSNKRMRLMSIVA